MNVVKRYINSASQFQVILFGFLILILSGSILLSLPAANTFGVRTPYVDALFTAASAACVTGLTVFDTASYWSVFGKTVILLLIQIGGLGVVTVAAAITILSGRKIGLMQRSVMQSSISAPSIGGIVRLTKFIVKGTFVIEGIGAALLAPVFIRDYGILTGLAYAVFHSVSAFCNAGFDILGGGVPFSSLMRYRNNVQVCAVIMILIIVGGIGFLTWSDLLQNKFRFRSLKLQSKIILIGTVVLIGVPFLYFYFGEFRNETRSARVLLALFQSVTPRTAGFSTADYSVMSEDGLMVTILLMLIGGAPGSTAGGMKITTASILFLAVFSGLRKKDHVQLFHRDISQEVIRDATALAGIYFLLVIGGAMVISRIEELPLLRCLFECASAIGTVGLTTGITPGLHTASLVILTGFMYFGRVGVLTISYATLHKRASVQVQRPVERVMVG